MTTRDWCRHCTNEAEMTREHLPPRSAGNDQPINIVDDAGTVIRRFNDGHAIPTLCDGCNNGASRRELPKAYKLWREDVLAAIKATTAAESKGQPFNIWRTSLSVDVDHNYALHPGRIARHVLGMLLAVQSRPQLITDHPNLRDAYFAEDDASIEPLTLHVALANTGLGYFADTIANVTLNLHQGTSQSTDMHLWCFAPFLATLVDGPAPPWPATQISHWFGHPTSYHFQRRDRKVSYPIAARNDPAVALLYRGSAL